MRFSTRVAAPVRTLLVAFAATMAMVSTSSAADIAVPIDQARIIKLEKQGAGIIVGNPSIADVSVQNGRLLVVTGKSAGVTNIIVLDTQQRKILSKRIAVKHDVRRVVTVHKGSQQFSYACKPTCRPTLMPGDEKDFFENLAKGTQNKLGLAQSVAEGAQAPQ